MVLVRVLDMKGPFGNTRRPFEQVLSDLDAEKSRCEELSVELLNLINTKNTLTREREQVIIPQNRYSVFLHLTPLETRKRPLHHTLRPLDDTPDAPRVCLILSTNA